MKQIFLFIALQLFLVGAGQTINTKLTKAYEQFERDSQLKYAISSLYVIDASTGQVVFDKNSTIGLAPASTQKIITSATAFELLGQDFRFKTWIGYDLGISNGELQGNLYVDGFGDPTLGSKRWKSTEPGMVMKKIMDVLKNKSIRKIRGDIWYDDMKLGYQSVPDGWIWQDIGNYYGAGCRGLNWCENQYDLVLQPSQSLNGITNVVTTKPVLKDFSLHNLVRTAGAGTGDNGYIYYAPSAGKGYALGTVPAGGNFTISGAIPEPAHEFANALSNELKTAGISFGQQYFVRDSIFINTYRKATLLLDSIMSPTLDSVSYWFLQKSINLYGEAFIRQIGLQSKSNGSTESGVEAVREFWKEKGIDEHELNMADGSGLSPLNRVTTHAQVQVLKYAKTKEWYAAYYHGFPLYNEMKMKSGTISDAKGFCGYHRAKDGKEYIFSFLVNNYNGRSSELVNKMYRVLNVLK